MAERGKAEDMQNFLMNAVVLDATRANAPEYTGRVELTMKNGVSRCFPFRVQVLLILILLSMNSIVYAKRTEPVIKIGITQSPPWTLRFAGEFGVYYRDDSGQWRLAKDRIDQRRKWTVEHEDHRLVLVSDLGDSIISDYPLRFVPVEETARLLLKDRVYKGELELWPAAECLAEQDEPPYVYNYLPLEEYVCSVLASEAYPGWNHQALSALAVAIRSYTLYNLGKHRDYDFCDQTHCQKYLGFSDHPSFSAAVQETQGEVLTWEGRVINAVYHSSSGGHTKNNEDVWGGDPAPYLRGVTDFDQNGQNYAWKQTPFFKVSQFSAALNLKGSGGLIIMPRFNLEGALIGFTFRHRRTKAGREVSNEELRRMFALPSGNFRLYHINREDLTKALQTGNLVNLGTAEVNQDYLTIQAELNLVVCSRPIQDTVVLSSDEYLLFIGNGSGHGVGLSQWGAQAMGELGHTYQAILRHFYGRVPQLTKLE